jgi:hypothetical protein
MTRCVDSPDRTEQLDRLPDIARLIAVRIEVDESSFRAPPLSEDIGDAEHSRVQVRRWSLDDVEQRPVHAVALVDDRGADADELPVEAPEGRLGKDTLGAAGEVRTPPGLLLVGIRRYRREAFWRDAAQLVARRHAEQLESRFVGIEVPALRVERHGGGMSPGHRCIHLRDRKNGQDRQRSARSEFPPTRRDRTGSARALEGATVMTIRDVARAHPAIRTAGGPDIRPVTRGPRPP